MKSERCDGMENGQKERDLSPSVGIAIHYVRRLSLVPATAHRIRSIILSHIAYYIMKRSEREIRKDARFSRIDMGKV